MIQVINALSESLGRALKWPLEIVDGKAIYVENLDLLKQSIRIILNWYFGTRFYLGEFGSKLERLLEEPNNSVLKASIDYEMGQALTRWEPRVKVIKTQLQIVSQDAITISITYQINKTNLVDVFIVNFSNSNN